MGIIAIKTERTQIHFLSDVLIAVASFDVKVPINLSRQERLIPAKVPHVTGYNMHIEFRQIFLFRILCCSRHYEIVCRIPVENES